MPAISDKSDICARASRVVSLCVLVAVTSPAAHAAQPLFYFEPELNWPNFFLGISFLSTIALIYLLFASWLYERRKNQPIEPEEPSRFSEFLTVLSFSRESDDDDDEDQEAEPAQPIPKREWSTELIDTLDGPDFERLCIRLWRLDGTSVEREDALDVEGVDFYLRSGPTKVRFGVVRCHSCKSGPIEVGDVRKLLEVKIMERLPLGLLMYNGELSAAAQATVDHPKIKIKAQGSDAILNKIMGLPEDLRNKLNNRTPWPD